MSLQWNNFSCGSSITWKDRNSSVKTGTLTLPSFIVLIIVLVTNILVTAKTKAVLTKFCKHLKIRQSLGVVTKTRDGTGRDGTGRDGTGWLLKYGTTGRDRNSSVRARLEAWSAKYGF